MIKLLLSLMLLLAPARDHSVLSGAIAVAVEEAPTLFRGDLDKHKTAALLVAVAFRESSLNARSVGDHGDSFCAFQIHRSSGGTPELNEAPEACARKALAMLRESARVCPEHPVAWYAEGPNGCSSPRAQRISRDRMSLAKWLAGKVPPE